MLKKTFSVFFVLFLIFSLFCPVITASAAYEVTTFDITAKAGMLVSLDTGEALYEKNIDEKLYPASITKIMTAIVILESDKFDPDGKIAMTEEILKLIMGTGSSVSNMVAGEEFTQLDMLYMILMSSFGDVTYLAAQYYGGSIENFVDMMNQKVAELGLTGTHFVNPVGLHDDEHYTTVRDIYTMTKYALEKSEVKTICSSSKYSFSTSLQNRTLTTTNFLLNPNTNYYYQYATGLKTGFTDEAGRCLVSTATYNGYTYMAIVMGCPGQKYNHFAESANLFRWGFLNFSFKEVASSDEPVSEAKVELSLESDFVPLYFEKGFVTILPNEADDSTIVVDVNLFEESVDAPVEKGQILGTADIIYAEQVIGTVNLVAGNDVKSSNILILFEGIKKVFSSVYMKVALWAIVAFIVIYILICIKLNLSKTKRRKVKYVPYKKHERERGE